MVSMRTMQMRMMGDVIRNIFTGYHESPSPTTVERTADRRCNIVKACQELLAAVVGAGDLLDSNIRSEFAEEAYLAVNACDGCDTVGCLRDPSTFATYNKDDVQHTYHTDGPFRDVAHAIVNHQEMLDEAFWDVLVRRLAERYPSHSMDDWRAMAVELGIVAACCAGVAEFCAAGGIPRLELPASPATTAKARFKSVSEYSSGPLQIDKSIAWGPYLSGKEFKAEAVDAHDFDHELFSFALGHAFGPTSKASAAPTTCMQWLRFMEVMYTPQAEAPFFLRVPGQDRTLTRGQLEVCAAAFNGAKRCTF